MYQVEIQIKSDFDGGRRIYHFPYLFCRLEIRNTSSLLLKQQGQCDDDENKLLIGGDRRFLFRMTIVPVDFPYFIFKC